MPPIRLSYYNKTPLPNFGDDLSPALIKHLTGSTITHAKHADAELFGVGSIVGYWASHKITLRRNITDLLLGRKPLAIWGTGLIRPKKLVMPRCQVLALRGPLTQQYTGMKDVPVLADPGILAKELVPTSSSKHDKIGIIPHYVDKTHPLIMQLRKDPAFTIIDVEQACQNVCAEIAACPLVLSSSLHGLVVADSYNIPNVRLIFTDEIIGGGFKFLDYALGVEREPVPTFRPENPGEISSIVDEMIRTPQMAKPEVINDKCAALVHSLNAWMASRSAR